MTATPHTFHVTREDEVQLTECGLLLPYLPPGPVWGDDEVVDLGARGATGWPSVDTPRGMSPCPACTAAYRGY